MIFNVWQYSVDPLTCQIFCDTQSHFNVEIFCTLLFYLVEYMTDSIDIFCHVEYGVNNLEVHDMHKYWLMHVMLNEYIEEQKCQKNLLHLSVVVTSTGKFCPKKEILATITGFKFLPNPSTCFWSFLAHRSCLYSPPVKSIKWNSF